MKCEIDKFPQGGLVLSCGDKGMVTDLVFSSGAVSDDDPDFHVQRGILEYIVSAVKAYNKKVGDAVGTGKEDAGKGAVREIHVKDMVKAYLKERGYDGLSDDECGCGLDDFAPCGEGPYPDCCAAKTEEHDGEMWFTPVEKEITTEPPRRTINSGKERKWK
jgi:hypothetical protein